MFTIINKDEGCLSIIHDSSKVRPFYDGISHLHPDLKIACVNISSPSSFHIKQICAYFLFLECPYEPSLSACSQIKTKLQYCVCGSNTHSKPQRTLMNLKFGTLQKHTQVQQNLVPKDASPE